MQYCLQTLNKSSNLTFLTLQNIIENLNLIGFEIDNILEENEQILLIIKIPANRDDLLSEQLFSKELIRLFCVENLNIWLNLKKSYSVPLKQNYLNHSNYKSISIKSSLKNILVYKIEIENFKNFVSPLWIQKKLKNFGYQPTKNLNDIINLINLEWGQTFTLYFSKKQKNQFLLEQLKESENFFDPSGNLIKLPKNSIVLKNNFNEIKNCLGYIFPSFVDEKETLFIQTIFYDININLLNINTINTKLSFRYLRKTFLDYLRFSFQRFLTLFEILNDSKKVVITKYTFLDENTKLNKQRILKLKKKSLLNFLNITEYDQENFLKAGLKIVCKTKTELYFQIPNTRKDLNREIDLIEEYSRFIGYKNFYEIKPQKRKIFIGYKNIKSYIFIKQFFINFGFYEVINSSLENYKKENKKSILLTNPLNNDFFLLRSELSSKVFQIFEYNFRKQGFVTNFFEIGRIFKKINNNLIEEDHLCTIFQSLSETNNFNISLDLFINKGIIETLFYFFGYTTLNFEINNTKNFCYHPTRSFLIKENEKLLGIFGEIHPSLNQFKTPIYILELNLFYFKDFKLRNKIHFSKELSKYPSIIKDLSFNISRKVNFISLKDILLKEINNLKNFYFFDIYFQEINKENINIGIHLEFQSYLETLTTNQIENEIKKLKEVLILKFKVIFID
jgi:phenylalanyl-tRNA synthetase beta chain